MIRRNNHPSDNRAHYWSGEIGTAAYNQAGICTLTKYGRDAFPGNMLFMFIARQRYYFLYCDIAYALSAIECKRRTNQGKSYVIERIGESKGALKELPGRDFSSRLTTMTPRRGWSEMHRPAVHIEVTPNAALICRHIARARSPAIRRTFDGHSTTKFVLPSVAQESERISRNAEERRYANAILSR